MVDDLSNLRAVRHAGNVLPPGILRHPKNVFGSIFVAVFLKAFTLFHKLVVTLIEAVADIFQKNESQHHILIFRSRKISTQLVRTVPYTVFDGLLFYCFCFLRHSIPVLFGFSLFFRAGS